MPFGVLREKESLNENHVLKTSDMHGYIIQPILPMTRNKDSAWQKVATKMKELRQAATDVVTIEMATLSKARPWLLHCQKPALRCRIDRCRQPPRR